MSHDILDFLTPSCELLAFGEPTHLAPAFGLVRNELFAQLAEVGFRSIAMETDRVAALAVDDFVRDGVGTLDSAMRGFSHTFGELAPNRQLIAWMREYNRNRPPEDRLSFHGFDASTEMMSAPSPRAYLEPARDYLGLNHDLATLAGDDDRWSRTEAILDPAESVGDTPEADRLRVIADDMLTELYARAPEAPTRAAWFRVKTQLTAGIDLLRYHKQSAQRIDETTRLNRMCATRDAIMAENLLDIRRVESAPTLVFAQNAHLQRNRSSMWMGPHRVEWYSAGAIASLVLGDRYNVVIGTLGRCPSIGLRDPKPDTYEGHLQGRVDDWGLVAPATVPPARARTDDTAEQGYFQLAQASLDNADAILHIIDGSGE